MFARGLIVLGFLVCARSAVAQTPDSLAAEAERYRGACTAGSMRDCTSLGSMYRDGRGVKQNDGIAGEFFRRACDGGDMRGCGILGGMYLDGRGVTQDVTRANQLFRRACDGGELTLGCVSLAMQYRAGRGVPQNDSLAFELVQRACAGGDPLGCALVPRMTPRPRPRR